MKDKDTAIYFFRSSMSLFTYYILKQRSGQLEQGKKHNIKYHGRLGGGEGGKGG